MIAEMARATYFYEIEILVKTYTIYGFLCFEYKTSLYK
jgi:hypothetical protein